MNGKTWNSKGHVLEVGFGTGLNLDCYPSSLRSLAGVDPMRALSDRVAERISRAPFPVERVWMSAEGPLPFGDAHFDCVVSTWTLCTIGRPRDALAEMRRVLKRGGRYRFIEHGRSDRASTASWQDRLNGIHRRIADGCNMNRPIDQLIREAGFEVEKLERFTSRGPRVLAEMYRGVARRQDWEANP
jgi:ubiquinone/menaquinone biosynthesis C-methylase UbiE